MKNSYNLIYCALILLLLLAMTAMAFGVDNETNEIGESIPGESRFLTDADSVSFPFDLYGGDIRFLVQINNHEVHFLLDDGFLWDDLLFWGSPMNDSLGFQFDGDISVGGDPDSENQIKSRTASGIRLSLPGVEFTNQSAVIMPYSSGTGMMWEGSAGQVSAAFFKHYIVSIDFDKMMITFYKPERYEYGGNGVAIEWKPLGFGPRAIPATLLLDNGETVTLDLLMDLGYNRQLQINTSGEHKIPVPKQSIKGSMGFNIQRKEMVGDFGRVSQIDIGGYKINNLLTGFIDDKDGDHTFSDAMVGLELLSRFNLIFDYHHQRIFIEPNGSFEKQLEYNMSGLWFVKGEGDYLSVRSVHPDSPASEAGIKVGDNIIKINDMNSWNMDYQKRKSLLRQDGAEVKLTIIQDAIEKEITIILRKII